MTTPYPAPGEFPDFEQVMVDLLKSIATTVSTLPATGDDFQSALPFIWARKTGGTVDFNAITYRANVRLAVFGSNRPQAQMLATQVRAAVLNAPAARVNGVLVDWVEEIAVTEPEFQPPTLRRSRNLLEFPDLDPLNQMVDLAFALDARRQ
ncbi:hypothetical protein [Nocardia arthritidis]|uniref:DUF3168 domain-containing protein n=1 Tax=Nocardia arthritidis TaxID=228602 RepID=A0A6G9YTF3_9NOCA|nr:hypothetical protein [Nocardia arthritidis]QIS16599.1 hypothetical protein F5544_43980 [Nocardia arthritidis]